MNENSSIPNNIKTWLESATEQLTQSGIGTARLDCLILLEDATGKDRSWLLAHPELELKSQILQRLDGQLKQRSSHLPLAYIRGKTEFYGREFDVDERVLEPRPETETMIDMLLQTVTSGQLTVNSKLQMADIGTGSGAIAITTKLELPEAEVWAIDVVQGCLDVASINSKKLKADIAFLKGDLLLPLSAIDCHPSVVLANLPYVPENYQINEAALQEPRIAIFGGTDGLELYRKMFKQIDSFGLKPGLIFTESLPFQHDELTRIAVQSGYRQSRKEDFIQLFEIA